MSLLSDLEALPASEWRDMTTAQWREALRRTPRYDFSEPETEEPMPPDPCVAVLIAAPLYARLLAACSGDSTLAREKLEYCIAAYCDADAAIREAIRQEEGTKCE